MQTFFARLASCLAVTLVVAAGVGVFPAQARPAATVSPSPPAAAEAPAEAEAPPLPFTGPVVRASHGHVTFFSAIPLGGEMAKVVKAHPEFDWLSIGMTWHAMRTIGEAKYILVVTANERGRISMVTIANVHRDRLPACVAGLQKTFGKPANPQEPFDTFKWEHTPTHPNARMPMNTRLAILPPGDVSPDLYAVMGVDLTEQNGK